MISIIMKSGRKIYTDIKMLGNNLDLLIDDMSQPQRVFVKVSVKDKLRYIKIAEIEQLIIE